MDQHRNTTATVRAVLAAAGDSGVEPKGLLAEAGIAEDLASDPDGEVTLPVMRRFWELAYERSCDPYLAVHAGLKAAHGSYRTLDYLMFAATTLGDGVSRFIEHFRLINTWLRFVVEEDDTDYRMVLRSEFGWVPNPAVEITFTVMTERCRRMLGAGWVPAGIRFQHEPPGEQSYYRGYFRCPVEFGSEEAVMSFSRDQWDTPLPGGDEGLFRVLESHAAILGAERPSPEDLVERARREVLRALKNGVPGVEEVADRLGVGTRTLQRRLGDQGVSYSQLVDAVREGQARELVAAGAMSMSETAFFLGFADQSAFFAGVSTLDRHDTSPVPARGADPTLTGIANAERRRTCARRRFWCIWLGVYAERLCSQFGRKE